MKKSILAAVAAVAFLSAPALAATKYHKPVPPPPPAPVPTWTGFYAGANVGYGWGQSSTSYNNFDAFIATLLTPSGIPASLSPTMNGLTGGVQGGYNYQIGRTVVGIEADYSALSMKGNAASNLPGNSFGVPLTTATSQQNKLTWLSTIRGRLGVLATPDWLLYATGGLAIGRAEASTSVFGNFGGGPCVGFAGLCAASSVSSTRTGWTAGGGTEYSLGQHWTVKAEYLYFDLGTASYGVAGVFIPGNQLQANAKFTGQIARAGINYRF